MRRRVGHDRVQPGRDRVDRQLALGTLGALARCFSASMLRSIAASIAVFSKSRPSLEARRLSDVAMGM